MNFDPERVLALAKMLDFPRAVNTPGEQSAADFIAREFRQAGLRVERRTIRVARIHYVLWPGLAVYLWLGIAMAFLDSSLIVQLALTTVGMATLIAAYVVNLRWSRGSLSIPTEQVVGDRPHDSLPPVRVVVFTRHATIIERYIFNFIILISVAGYVALIILLAPAVSEIGMWSRNLRLSLLAGWWVSQFLMLGLPENLGAEERSKRYRTGLAILAELARTWPKARGDRVEVLFVTTGGIWNGPANLGEFLRRDATSRPTLVINLDAPGLGSRLVLVGSKMGVALANEAAKGLWLPHRVSRRRWESPLPACFKGPGLTYVSIRGDQRSAPIDPAALNATGQLVIEMALRWAKQSGVTCETRQPL
ncbi:MAG: hypothetical protein ABI353_09595 [Isosphaeraceae bacterium]